ncbi:MAG: ATP-binding protein [Treponema sp.]|nr:ATP-binding protein [Treponema sp.]
MTGRGRRRLGIGKFDKKLYGMSIEDISKDDLLSSVAYLFLLTQNANAGALDVVFAFIEKIVLRLGLWERMAEVLQKYVVFLEEKKILRRCDAIRDIYDIDQQIELYHGALCGEEKNFYRIMLSNGTGKLSQILFHIFFNKYEVNFERFQSELTVRFAYIVSNTAKVDFLKKELDLSEEEARYLLFQYRKLTIDGFDEVLDSFDYNPAYLCKTVLGITQKEFKQITRSDSKLRQFGFIEDGRNIDPAIVDIIDNQDLSIYFSDFVKTQDLDEAYPLDSFPVPEKNSNIYKGLLQSDASVSLLLYGAPGSGKTEYAKALVKSAGKKALVFKNESEVMSKDVALSRLNCLLSLNRKDTVLIVDEADSLLSTSRMTMFGPFESSKTKGLVNKMLELSQNKVIWVVNYISQMDESTLRRFTVSHKFEPMSVSMLEKIAEKKLEKLEIEKSSKKEIVRLLSKYKVTGASVENLITTINSMKDKTEEAVLENLEIVLKDNSSLLHGSSKMRAHVKESYDMSVLNTSLSAKKIMNMLYNAKKFAEKNPESGAVRMLFYGLSGTGKTEFARYISESLGKELLLKRASDIFDKFVGGTEQNIASAFEEAAKNDQILLFDEADSFFSDRKNAERNFERTQVNEFLTQLEEFPGIVICTTNLRNIMDPAMLRRFHITVDFKALTEEGVKKLLKKFFSDHSFEEEHIRKLCAYGTATPGDFGRLSDTIKFMDPEEVTAEYIIDQLCEIQNEKADDGGSARRIGFCA